MALVLVTEGKNDSVYAVKVKIFDNKKEAQNYCDEINAQPLRKYWTKAEVITPDEVVELSSPWIE